MPRIMRFVLDSTAFPPEKKRLSDAGWDLRSPEDFTIPPFKSASVDLKIAFEIPDGCYGAIESRSGLAFNSDITAHRGIIDSEYRGTVKVKLFNHSEFHYHVKRGDKICQLIVHKYEDVVPVKTEVLTSTSRGADGFGSTGR